MSVLVGRHHSASPRMNIFLGLLKSHVVLIVALAAAAVTCFFVTPDAAYADYFDLDTLSCLFCTLAVVSALKERRFFEWLAGKIVTAFGNMRRVAFALVFVTYFGSMIMANDMALVTFLPLGFYVLSSCGKKEYTAFVFVMQNVAANLGGMLTPFGNPPEPLSLFLLLHRGGRILQDHGAALRGRVPAHRRHLPLRQTRARRARDPGDRRAARVEDDRLLRPLRALRAHRVPRLPLLCRAHRRHRRPPHPRAKSIPARGLRAAAHLLRLLRVLGQPRAHPRRRAGPRLPRRAIPLLVGAASCQVISNVPSAVLLSRFTTDYRHLLVAVNIGGLGTPVSSLASLITLGEYRKREPGKTGRYLALFSLVNFLFLAVLIGASYLNDLIL